MIVSNLSRFVRTHHSSLWPKTTTLFKVTEPEQNTHRLTFRSSAKHSGEINKQTTDDYEYVVVSEKDADQIWPLLSKAFFPREPITLGIGAVPEDIKNFACAGIPGWTTSGVSSGVRDKKSGQLLGVMLVNIMTKENPTTFTNLGEDSNDKIKMTRAVLSYLETSFDVFEVEKVDTVGEMAMLTVDPNYAGRGIATKLTQMAEDLLVKKGITIAYAQTTNIVSQKVLGKCGYKTRHTVDFGTFEINGTRILDLSKMEGTTKANIVTKRIGMSEKNK